MWDVESRTRRLDDLRATDEENVARFPDTPVVQKAGGRRMEGVPCSSRANVQAKALSAGVPEGRCLVTGMQDVGNAQQLPARGRAVRGWSRTLTTTRIPALTRVFRSAIAPRRAIRPMPRRKVVSSGVGGLRRVYGIAAHAGTPTLLGPGSISWEMTAACSSLRRHPAKGVAERVAKAKTRRAGHARRRPLSTRSVATLHVTRARRWISSLPVPRGIAECGV